MLRIEYYGNMHFSIINSTKIPYFKFTTGEINITIPNSDRIKSDIYDLMTEEEKQTSKKIKL
jgi:hypothetical protein